MAGERKLLSFSEGVSVSAPTSFGESIATKTNDYEIVAGDNVILVDATGQETDVTLPDPALFIGSKFYVKKIDSSDNAVVVLPNDAEEIDGDASYPMQQQNESGCFVTDGTNWYTL